MQQTVYAELLDRCLSADFGAAFPENGTFVSKEIRGRRYWYFQESGAKRQRYVGPENAELLERIARHRQIKDSDRDRRSLVSTLVRSANLPRPLPAIGDILTALAASGVFRLRGVLVGTVAFQTYSASLGLRLPRAAMETLDVDIAQDRNISVAVKDSVQGLLDALRGADPTFRPVPPKPGADGSWSYATGKEDIRVEFLTPNRGRDSDAAVHLPALDTYAQQLRFLDYLIRDPQPAVVLHGPGILVNVPAPERYALHKLIVARRRSPTSGKIGKDLDQAQSLLSALVAQRPHELREAWNEAVERGAIWRRLMLEGLGQVSSSATRDQALRVAGAVRGQIPGLKLTLSRGPGRYDSERDAVVFEGRADGHLVSCMIGRLALDDHFDADGATKSGCLEIARKHRDKIGSMLNEKYLHWPIDEPGSVLLDSIDVERLSK